MRILRGHPEMLHHVNFQTLYFSGIAKLYRYKCLKMLTVTLLLILFRFAFKKQNSFGFKQYYLVEKFFVGGNIK